MCAESGEIVRGNSPYSFVPEEYLSTLSSRLQPVRACVAICTPWGSRAHPLLTIKKHVSYVLYKAETNFRNQKAERMKFGAE